MSFLESNVFGQPENNEKAPDLTSSSCPNVPPDSMCAKPISTTSKELNQSNLVH